MRKFQLTVSFVFTAIILGIAYAIIDGIMCGSILGVSLGVGSLAAMIVCFRLFKRLVNEEENGG